MLEEISDSVAQGGNWDGIDRKTQKEDWICARMMPQHAGGKKMGVIWERGERINVRDGLLAGGLVEDEDVAGPKYRARQAEELLLAVREVDFVDVGV